MPAVTVTSAPPLLVTSEVSGLTGLLCEIGLISSVALGDNSTLEFSFALPHVRPQYDAVLACFTAPGMALQPGGVSVASATEYHNGARRPISADLMPEVDTLTIPDALANDPYFAESYRQTRYDDIPRSDPALGDVVSWNGDRDAGYTRSAADNCVMLSAEWQSDRIYTVGLDYPNPPAGAGNHLGLWIAPLSGGAGADDDPASGWSYTIRGHKYGMVCGCGTSDVAGDTNSRSCAENTGAELDGPDGPNGLARTAAVEATMQGSTEPGGAFGPKRQADAATVLAEQLCDTFSAEKTKLEAGEMSDQLVPGAMWRAFMLDATALVDWQLIWHTNASLWSRALDGRRPGFPTREHGIGNRCASLKGACDPETGLMIDVRTTGARRWGGNVPVAEEIQGLLDHGEGTFDPGIADRRYKSEYTFGLIGEVLLRSRAQHRCEALLLPAEGQGDGEGGVVLLGNERGGAWPQDVSEL